MIVDCECARIVVQRVHGDVTAHGILLECAVDIVAQQEATGGAAREMFTGLVEP